MNDKQDTKVTTSIIHQNVQSLGNAVDRVNAMLNLHDSCEILCITEHWKSDKQLKKLGINNFHLVSMFCREEGKHGGSAIYFKRGLKGQARRKLNNINKWRF